MITTGALGIFFVIFILILAAQRFLLPGIIIIGGFILFVLWLTGLVETSLQLYGVVANVNDNCRNYIDNVKPVGDGWKTLAWIEEETICKYPSFSDDDLGEVVWGDANWCWCCG